MSAAGAKIAALATIIRRICGMPDYAAYCAHLQQAHPEQPLPTRRAHFDAYLRSRYADGPTRCC